MKINPSKMLRLIAFLVPQNAEAHKQHLRILIDNTLKDIK